MFKRIAVVGLAAVLGLVPAIVRADGAKSASTPSSQTEKKQPDERPSAKEVLTDAAIIAILIAASQAAYHTGAKGPCGWPDDVDRKGHRCGGRSAHDRPGGWVVHCFPSDITPAMISEYRSARAQAK
jgi:hypothetical protein